MRKRYSSFVLPILTAISFALVATDSIAGESNHIKSMSVMAADSPDSVDIRIDATSAATYQVRTAENGKKIVVDLFDTTAPSSVVGTHGKVGVVGGVFTQTFKENNRETTRVEINLLKNATYRVRQEGSVFHILVSPPVLGIGNEGSVQVSDVQFDRLPAQPSSVGKCLGGCDRIVIRASGSPSYQVVDGLNNKLRLVIKNSKLSESMERTLDVTPFRGPLRYISTFAEKTTGNTVVEIERSTENRGEVVVEGDKLVWNFELPKIAHDGGAARRTVTLEREATPDVAKIDTKIGKLRSDVEMVSGEQAGFLSTVPAQAIGSTGKYTGRQIDLDLKDADIHNILRLLSDVGHVNIVTADDVSGTVTIRMKNVPWDHALDVVLQAKGLGMVRQGNLIRVAPMATLQKERELRIAQQKQDLDLAPLETRIIPISYAHASDLQSRAKDFLSPRGSLAVDERTNVLIGRDVSGNLNRIEELVRSLDTQTPQVLVEARIVEATSRYLRDVGIQWGGDMTFSEATGNPTGVAFPSRVGTAGGASADPATAKGGLGATTPNFAINLPAAVGQGVGGALGLVFGSMNNNFNLNVRLSAAEASGMVRIVSSPRILTLDNREARINQGTLIPFSQLTAQGVQTTFQEAKLQLIVKPHVTADGSVAMHVKINRDEPDFNQTGARGDPTILKREAETDLLVMDGHTAVIGGIFTRNTGRNVDQIPFFGDLPILGVLFQRRRASDARNELVIFLSPRIVNRAEALGR